MTGIGVSERRENFRDNLSKNAVYSERYMTII